MPEHDEMNELAWEMNERWIGPKHLPKCKGQSGTELRWPNTSSNVEKPVEASENALDGQIIIERLELL